MNYTAESPLAVSHYESEVAVQGKMTYALHLPENMDDFKICVIKKLGQGFSCPRADDLYCI